MDMRIEFELMEDQFQHDTDGILNIFPIHTLTADITLYGHPVLNSKDGSVVRKAVREFRASHILHQTPYRSTCNTTLVKQGMDYLTEVVLRHLEYSPASADRPPMPGVLSD